GNSTRNCYELRNGLGQRIYYALEEPSCGAGDLCRDTRGFTLRIQDSKQCNVMQIFRPCRSQTRWCPGCLETMVIRVPEGVLIGCVSQMWHPFEPKFCVDVSGETALNISGPCRLVSCFSDDHFRVMGPDKMTMVGKIWNKCTGVAAEYFTNSDCFGVQFPVDLDVNIKATLIGASFLISDLTGQTKGLYLPGAVWMKWMQMEITLVAKLSLALLNEVCCKVVDEEGPRSTSQDTWDHRSISSNISKATNPKEFQISSESEEEFYVVFSYYSHSSKSVGATAGADPQEADGRRGSSGGDGRSGPFGRWKLEQWVVFLWWWRQRGFSKWCRRQQQY
ncbi:PLS1 scramblase, partial [Polyodon spathula]|nr:PLS1 scramblase [Polyodon spathula]